MSKRVLMLISYFFIMSCDMSNYKIIIQDLDIETVGRNGGAGSVVISSQAAENILQYGEVNVYGRYCQTTLCIPLAIGSINKDNYKKLRNGVRFEIEFSPGAAAPINFPPFWLNKVRCIYLDAGQGMMGRTGRSSWYCPMALNRNAG